MLFYTSLLIINKFCFAEEFCTNVPKNPIRILHETKLQPNFRFVLLNLLTEIIYFNMAINILIYILILKTIFQTYIH